MEGNAALNEAACAPIIIRGRPAGLGQRSDPVSGATCSLLLQIMYSTTQCRLEVDGFHPWSVPRQTSVKVSPRSHVNTLGNKYIIKESYM